MCCGGGRGGLTFCVVVVVVVVLDCGCDGMLLVTLWFREGGMLGIGEWRLFC